MTEPAAPPAREEERADAPIVESRFRRSLRYGHRTALYAALAAIIVTGVYLILLISSNTDKVELDYVFGSARTRLIWLIVVSAIAGWILGLATNYLVRRRTRRPR